MRGGPGRLPGRKCAQDAYARPAARGKQQGRTDRHRQPDLPLAAIRKIIGGNGKEDFRARRDTHGIPQEGKQAMQHPLHPPFYMGKNMAAGAERMSFSRSSAAE